MRKSMWGYLFMASWFSEKWLGGIYLFVCLKWKSSVHERERAYKSTEISPVRTHFLHMDKTMIERKGDRYPLSGGKTG